MNNNRFYIPKLEELHIGLEYESAVTFKDGKINSVDDYIKALKASGGAKWYKQRVESVDDMVYVERALTDTNNGKSLFGIIVKRLNKDDIISLGFKYKDTRNYHTRNGVEESGFSLDIGDGSFCHIRLFLDSLNIVNSGISIEVTDIYERKISNPWDGFREGGSTGISDIRVKNKSELKVLLKQLGININEK